MENKRNIRELLDEFVDNNFHWVAIGFAISETLNYLTRL
jgi:hypothetical protein